MQSQQSISLNPSKRQKLQTKRQKAKEKYEKPTENKPLSKQEIRKEKNRLAAQKSRDRKQEHLESMEKENIELKRIISHCEKCSQAHQQLIASQQEGLQEDDFIFRQRSIDEERQRSLGEEPILVNSSPPTFSPPSLFIREEEDSHSSNVSKYFWFCFFTAVICIVQFGGQNTELPHLDASRITFEVNNSGNHSKLNLNDKDEVFNKKMKKSLVNYTSKQCSKCMECFRNMTTTNSTSLTPINQTSNSTRNNQTIAKNSTNKILFCKSKALFFKKIYNALNKNEKSSTHSGEVARVQASGKMLSEFMDRDCFVDSVIDENQLYTIEFTVAIMELEAIKDKPKNLTKNVQVHE